MITRTRVFVYTLSLLIFAVQGVRPVCVEVPSDTEAVLGRTMKLTCISCVKREEVSAQTRVDWYYVTPLKELLPIFLYDSGKAQVLDSPWAGRLNWTGSKDLQDVSLRILNVSHQDNGTYVCKVFRQFTFDSYMPSITNTKKIHLVVRERASTDATAMYSEIMMYVLLVCLTFWLLVEMVYCYRKISTSDEQTQDTVTNYLAVPSPQKDNMAAPLTEQTSG
ncbi:sodium channel regulatory subunit beta-3 [Aplochiton taeniatus]